MAQWKEFSVSKTTGPYVDWMREPGKKFTPDYFETERIGCFLGLVEGKSLHDLDKIISDWTTKFISEKSDLEPRFDIPEDLFATNNFVDFEHSFFTGFANADFFTAVDQNPEVSDVIERVIVAQQLANDAYCPKASYAKEMSTQVKDTRKVKPCKGTVVIGVIDEGIAFGHEKFRQSLTKTRVEYSWIQDGKCQGPAAGVSYGREHRKSDWKDSSGISYKGIDSILKSSQIADQIDEELFYRRVGIANFERSGHKAAARRTAHGTHVMDLACGYEMGHSPIDCDSKSPCYGQDQRPIICVQLPSRTVADTSGLGLEKYMIDGVIYILNKAEELASSRNCEALPVIINFSSGVLAGPHDGTHPVEIAIEQLLSARRKAHPNIATEIILPAGNSFLSQAHARLDLEKSKPAQLTWRLQPDDKTYNFLEIWLPREAVENSAATTECDKKLEPYEGITLKISPPNGESSECLKAGRENFAFKWQPDGDNKGVVCKVYYEFIKEPKSCYGRGRFTIITLPTAFHQSPTKLAPSGDWTLELENHADCKKTIHAWVQWDDRPLSYPIVGRQSYFIDESYNKFNMVTGRVNETDSNESSVKRFGTINAIGTSLSSITIAGFFNNELRPTSYSAAGEVTDIAWSRKSIANPLAAVASDDSVVSQGILAAGSRSGSTVIMNGTSVAAPQVTRWLGDQLANCASSRNSSQLSTGCRLVKRQAESDEHGIKSHAAKHFDPNNEGDGDNTNGNLQTQARIGNGRIDIYKTNLTTAQRLRQPQGSTN